MKAKEVVSELVFFMIKVLVIPVVVTGAYIFIILSKKI